MRKILLVSILVFLVSFVYAESKVTNFPTLSPKSNLIKIEPGLTIIQPTEGRDPDDTIKYDGAEGSNGVGYGSAPPPAWWGAVRFTPVLACTVKAAIFYHYNGPSPISPAYIYLNNSGTTTSPGTVIESVPYTGNPGFWIRADFTTPLFRNSGQDFWVVVKFMQTAGGYPAGCDVGPGVVPARSFYSGDNITWSDWTSLGIDNNFNLRAIGTFVRLNNDVGVDAILSPGSSHLVNTLMTPSARIKNYGSSTNSFSVRCSIINASGTVRHVNQQSVTSLVGSDTITKTFGSWTPTVSEILTVYVTTYLGTDQNPANNQMTTTTNVGNYIIIGTGTTSSPLQPMYRYYNYSAHEAIYLQSEIGVAGNITHIAYDKASGADVNPIQYVTIYMKQTADATLATGNFDLVGYTQVYNGSYTNNATTGWMEVQLDSPFAYDNSSNLQVLVIKGYEAYISNYSYYKYTTTTSTMSRYNYDDYTAPTTLTSTTMRPNLRLQINSTPPPTNDVGVVSVLSPTGTVNMRTTTIVPVRAKVKNYGTANQTSFAVRCTIWGPGHTQQYTNSRTISLNAGDTVTIAFDNWTPSTFGACSVIARTMLTDENPANDRKVAIATLSRAYFTGGPDAGNMRWIDSDTTGGPVYNWRDISATGTSIDFGTNYDDNTARIPIGFSFNFYETSYDSLWVTTNGFVTFGAGYTNLSNDSIPTVTTPNNGIYLLWDDLHALALGKIKYQVLGTAPNCTLVVSWDNIRYYSSPTGDSTLTFQVLLCQNSGNIIAQYRDITTGNGAGQDNGMLATVGTENATGSTGLNYIYNGKPAGNILAASRAIKYFVQPLTNDVGVEAILSPLATHAVNTLMTPSASVRNYGIANQPSFSVVCSIFGYTSGLLYSDIRIISLDAGLTTPVNFNSWTPLVGESTTVKMATYLGGDERTSNDVKTRLTVNTLVIDAGVTAIARPFLSKESETKRAPFTPEVTVTNNGSYSADVSVIMEIRTPATGVMEGFEDVTFPPAGWQAIPISGTWNWARSTAGLNPVCTPYEGTAMATYPAFNATPIGCMARLITPQIDAGATPQPCSVRFMMFHDSIYPSSPFGPDSVRVAYSLGTPGPFMQVASIRRYEPSTWAWTQHTVYLGTFSGVYYVAFTAFSDYGNDIYIDNVIVGDYSPATLLYRDSVLVNVASGTDVSMQAYFRPCTLMTEGSYNVKAYTILSGDMNTANDMLEATTTVGQATLTLSAPGNGSSTSDHTPTFSWNEVAGAELYRIEVDNNDDFSSPEFAGELSDLEMESDALLDGLYYWHVRVQSPGTPDNYSETWTLTVYTPGEPGWTAIEDIPAPLDIKPGKFMKDGGSMIGVGGAKDGDNIFMFPGNKSWYFYMYTPGEPGIFTTLESIPYGFKPTDPTKYNKKKIGKGAALCYDGTGIIYATKGNGTVELWAYDILANTWTAKAFVPVPKALKGGTSLAYLGGKLYLLAGGQKKTDLNNFYVYDVATDAWTTGASLELGANIKVWKDGACLAELGGVIYALKTNDKANLFYGYDILGNVWNPVDSMPVVESLYGKANKKVIAKDGAAMVSGGSSIYAIKGGGANVFWKFNGTAWSKLESIPRLHKKSVAKTGAAMAFANNRIWLMKGNNTSEFWCYTRSALNATRLTPTTVVSTMVEKTSLTNVFSFNVAPNPFNRTTIIRYTVPVAGKVSVKLYSTSGRVVETVNNSYLNQGNYTTTLNANTLASGVYFLRYEDNTNRAEIKLIVE